MIVRVAHPDQIRSMLRPVTTMFEDFLRRAREVFNIQAQWGAVLRALAEGERTYFAIAFDDHVDPKGYVIAQDGYDFWGVHHCWVIQMYAVPGSDVRQKMMEELEAWAQSRGCHLLTASTQRNVKTVAKVFDATPYGVTMIRALVPKEPEDVEGTPTNPASYH